ncbi:MAG: DegT/DnrJ/EryC1/StrS family aminotransferase [Anaerolineae bacterium]
MAKIPLVDLKAQYATIKDEIDAAMSRVVNNTSFIGGKELTDFEAAFAAFQQTERCVGCASGTAAIFLALLALGIGEGDEVITTAHTFIASVEPIETLGATTVLVDIDPVTYNIDPAKLEAAITPRTKAILPVHLYGQLAPMDAIMEIARRHNLYVVEDAAQAHGAELNGKRAGAWGIAACFSFYPGKNLGAYGDGGAICTNDPVLADKMAKLRDHGRTTKYEHDEIGYGERLDSLQAAILGAKLPHLNGWNDARRHHAEYYNQALAGIDGISTPKAMDGARHIYHIYCIRVQGDRDGILAELNARGIGADSPIHRSICNPRWRIAAGRTGDFPNAERAAGRSSACRSHPELTMEQLNQITEDVADVVAAWKCGDKEKDSTQRREE